VEFQLVDVGEHHVSYTEFIDGNLYLQEGLTTKIPVYVAGNSVWWSFSWGYDCCRCCFLL